MIGKLSYFSFELIKTLTSDVLSHILKTTRDLELRLIFLKNLPYEEHQPDLQYISKLYLL